MTAPVRLSPDADLLPVLTLLRGAFAYMEGVIDPPSSLTRMGPAELARAATEGELWVIPPGPLACVVLTPRPDTLYLGKLAVSGQARGQGLAHRLVEHACHHARALGLPHVTLETRIELTANQATFRAMGFVETGRSAHPGYDRPTTIAFRRSV